VRQTIGARCTTLADPHSEGSGWVLAAGMRNELAYISSIACENDAREEL